MPYHNPANSIIFFVVNIVNIAIQLQCTDSNYVKLVGYYLDDSRHLHICKC